MHLASMQGGKNIHRLIEMGFPPADKGGGETVKKRNVGTKETGRKNKWNREQVIESERWNVSLTDGMPRESKTLLLAFNLFRPKTCECMKTGRGQSKKGIPWLILIVGATGHKLFRAGNLQIPPFALLPPNRISDIVSVEQVTSHRGFYCFGTQVFPLLCKLSSGEADLHCEVPVDAKMPALQLG